MYLVAALTPDIFLTAVTRIHPLYTVHIVQLYILYPLYTVHIVQIYDGFLYLIRTQDTRKIVATNLSEILKN
jgi:hypothetical protein